MATPLARLARIVIAARSLLQQNFASEMGHPPLQRKRASSPGPKSSARMSQFNSFLQLVPAWKTSWSRQPNDWWDHADSLREAFETFRIIESEVPKLQEYARRHSQLKSMPWMEIAREIADGVRRQDAQLESAADIKSIEDLREYVNKWRKQCRSVDELIKWQLIPGVQAAKILATFSRPGAYEQPCLC